MSRYNDAPPRHRPEPLALGAGPHHQHHPPPLYSAPLPYMSQPAYASIPQQQQQQQQQLGPRFQATPQTANALAEFQHAQQAYLAELNRTIEHQILVQQQVEREAAYRMLALQQQQREQYGLHQATAAAATAQPPWQQQQQAYAQQYGYGVGQQQHVSLSQQQQQRATNNPLVASALARRQRQEAATALEQEQAQAQASRRNKTTPSPPAVILSAPGEPYPDTSSSGSDSGETRPTSPESLAHATTTTTAAAEGKKPPRGGDEVKAARRRSHLDALTHTVEHAEERMRRRRPVSIAGPADLASPPHQQPSHHRYQTEQYRQLSPRWPSPASQGRRHPTPPRISSDPLLSSSSSAPPPPSSAANATFRSHSAASAASASTCSSSSSTTVVPPTPSAPTTTRVGPAPPIPGTASAIRQPRGPPTDLDAAQNNFAARIRARAIESLKEARHGRTSAAAAAAAQEEGGFDASALTTSLVDMRLTTT